MSKSVRIGIISSLFVLTTLLMFWGQITGKSFFWEDFTEQVYPVQNFSAVETGKGNIPVWNPYSFSGMPFLADPQVGWFYPPNRLMGLFVTDGRLNPSVIQIFIILHFLLAQITMYLLLRHFGRSTGASMIAGVGYAFSMIFICHVFHPMMIYQFAWFPLAFMLFKKALDKGSLYYGLWSGAVFAMMFHAGHPQTTVYLLLAILAYFVWDLVGKARSKKFEEKNAIFKFIGAAAAAGVIASGLYMVQLLPTRQLQEHAVRSEMTYEKTAEGSMELKQFFQIAIPGLFGKVTADNSDMTEENKFNLTKDGKPLPYYYYWDTGFYFGIAILLFGIVGFISGYKKKIPGFMLFLAIFGFLYAFGSNFFIHPLLNKLPVLDYFRMPARIMILAVFGFTVAAAYGFDYLRHRSEDLKTRRKALWLAAILPGVIIAGVLIGIIPGAAESNIAAESYVKSQAGLALLFLLIALAVGFILPKIKGDKAVLILATALSLSLFFDLFYAGGELNSRTEKTDEMSGRLVPFTPEKEYELPGDLEKILKPNPPEDIFRVNTRIPRPINYPVIKRNHGMISGLMMTDGYNQLNLAHRVPPFENYDLRNDMVNAKIAFILKDGGVRYYDNIDRYGHFRFFDDYTVVPAEKQADMIKNNSVDFTKTVLIDSEPEIKPAEGKASAKCTKYESNHIVCEISADADKLLLVNEIWYPAWKAYLNGEPTNIYRADHSLRAVEIPAGTHTLEMKYESSALKAGGRISFITLALLAAGLIFTGTVRRKSKNN